MPPLWSKILLDRRLLIVVAAPKEACSVLAGCGADCQVMRQWEIREARGDIDVLLTGVGKANAAGAVAHALGSVKYGAVVNIGLAGALPRSDGEPRVNIGDVILAEQSRFADEGVQTPTGFIDVAAMGFPPTEHGAAGLPVSPLLFEILRPLATHSGIIATVSTCSGTDSLAHAMHDRTGAIAEAMEGAAVLLAAHRLGIPAAEIRVISNTTGDRDRQVWDFGAGFAGMRRVMEEIAGSMKILPRSVK